MLCIRVLVILFVGLGGAFAQSFDTSSGNYYLSHCRMIVAANGPAGYLPGVCMGAISAIAYWAPSFPGRYRSCRPATATREQTVRVVLQFLESHPGRLHETFMDLAAEALVETWPCKN